MNVKESLLKLMIINKSIQVEVVQFLLKLELINKGFDINKFDEIIEYLKQMEIKEEKKMMETILSKNNSSEEKKDLIDTILGIK